MESKLKQPISRLFASEGLSRLSLVKSPKDPRAIVNGRIKVRYVSRTLRNSSTWRWSAGQCCIRKFTAIRWRICGTVLHQSNAASAILHWIEKKSLSCERRSSILSNGAIWVEVTQSGDIVGISEAPQGKWCQLCSTSEHPAFVTHGSFVNKRKYYRQRI